MANNCQISSESNSMKVQWTNKTDKNKYPAALIKEIKTYISFTDENQVVLKSNYDFIFDALFGKVEHSFNLNHDVLYQEFKRSVIQAFQSNQLSQPNSILDIFQDRCRNILKNNSKYVLITSINVKNNYLPKCRKVNDCVVNLSLELYGK